MSRIKEEHMLVDRGAADRLHVLRLASVFEPQSASFDGEAARFDPIGGMQNHTAALSRSLDGCRVRQTVLTSRLAAPTGTTPLGQHGVIRRVGVRTPRLRQLWALCALPRLFTTRQIDVVHAHQGEDVAVLLLGMLAAIVHSCPLVVTVHCSVRHTVTGGGIRQELVRGIGGPIERLALHRAAATVVLVARTARALAADGIPEDRLHVLPSGFEPALFSDSGPDPFPDVPHPRVGYVGRLAEQKAPHLAVEAFAGVGGEASLLMVGDGPLRPVVEAAVKASPARHRVTTCGFVPHSRVPAVLGSLDLLVLPSMYEEMGSVLVEAMASGLPVVASNVGGIPEVVVDGVTGVLVPAGDVSALTDALERLLSDPAQRRRMGEAARRRSVSYSWSHLADRVAAVYDSALKRAPAPAE